MWALSHFCYVTSGKPLNSLSSFLTGRNGDNALLTGFFVKYYR